MRSSAREEACEAFRSPGDKILIESDDVNPENGTKLWLGTIRSVTWDGFYNVDYYTGEAEYGVDSIRIRDICAKKKRGSVLPQASVEVMDSAALSDWYFPAGDMTRTPSANAVAQGGKGEAGQGSTTVRPAKKTQQRVPEWQDNAEQAEEPPPTPADYAGDLTDAAATSEKLLPRLSRRNQAQYHQGALKGCSATCKACLRPQYNLPHTCGTPPSPIVRPSTEPSTEDGFIDDAADPGYALQHEAETATVMTAVAGGARPKEEEEVEDTLSWLDDEDEDEDEEDPEVVPRRSEPSLGARRGPGRPPRKLATDAPEAPSVHSLPAGVKMEAGAWPAKIETQHLEQRDGEDAPRVSAPSPGLEVDSPHSPYNSNSVHIW